MFIGREKELKELSESLNKHSFQAVLVYGRRRVGKTELISQSLLDCSYRKLPFEFRKTTLAGNMNLFVPYVKEFFDEPNLSFDSFDSLFDYLLKKSLEEEYVLYLDEFSFLLNEDFSIESSLASAIDRYKSKSKIHLYISGSYVGLMERMIGKNAHSYGRFNHIISLKPFDYYDSAKFYPNYSFEDKIMLYSVFGGVPFFNSLIDTEKTALDNIFDLVVKIDSICEHELSETVIAETTKAPLLNELLLIILRGKCKYSDIYSEFASQGYGKPDYLLEKLLDMEFISKTYPINAQGNKKKTKYEIKDNLVEFFYRYIFVARSRELRKEPDFYYEHFIKEDFLHEFIPHKFERISREFLLRMNFLGKIKPVFFQIGEYYCGNQKEHLNRQFDIVTEDERGYISYECKYTEAPIGNKVIYEEERQTANLPGISFYRLGFIAKNGFAEDADPSKYNLFTLSDFYA